MQSPACAADPVYFLLHIPRTAGQTIEFHLEEHAAPGTVWMPRHLPGGPMLAKPRHDLSQIGDPRSVRAVVGHDVGRSLERYFEGRVIRRVVLLRDPIGHRLSLYNYRMMNYLNKGLGTYSFGLHVQALPRDWVAHRLLYVWLEISWARLMVMGPPKTIDSSLGSSLVSASSSMCFCPRGSDHKSTTSTSSGS